MTASQSCKSDRRARRLSTGHGPARSHIMLSPQIVRQFTTFDATRRSFMSRFTVSQLAEPAQLQSRTSPVALKSL
jgi:hypothetical protein